MEWKKTGDIPKINMKDNNTRQGGWYNTGLNWDSVITSLIDFCNYKTIVEIGVLKGETTKKLCEVAEKVGGKVFGYDFFGEIGFYTTGTVVSNTQQQVEDFIGKKYFDQNICKLTKIDTMSDEFTKVLAEDTAGEIDLAFIDGCHSYDGTKSDFEKVYANLSPEGTIVFHDTFSHAGPRKFMLDLYDKYNDGTFDLINLPFGGGPGCDEYNRIGLAILHKRSYLMSNGGVINNSHDDHNPIDLQTLYDQEQKWYKSQLKNKKA
jgi:hypothetical protein|tara:strand:+ start:111 stop:899 length:789 start_codon:yes stop_codon:yes gene_type:complete